MKQPFAFADIGDVPRPRRIQRVLPGYPNHLVCRGNNRRRLFTYPRDYHCYLRLLAVASEEFQCHTHALCLMANHVHILMTPPSVEAVSKTMKRLNQRYAQIRNEHYGGSGKLFEQSFYSEPVLSERHQAYCTLYINANPHRAGVRNPLAYPWSTDAIHRGCLQRHGIPKGMIVPDAWYSSLGRTQWERQTAYSRLFSSYLLGEVGDEFLRHPRPKEDHNSGGRLPRRPNGQSAAETLLDFG